MVPSSSLLGELSCSSAVILLQFRNMFLSGPRLRARWEYGVVKMSYKPLYFLTWDDPLNFGEIPLTSYIEFLEYFSTQGKMFRNSLDSSN